MATMKQRRATEAQWSQQNPVLAAGELGVEVGGTGAPDRFKIGNGLSPWKQLKYFVNETLSSERTGVFQFDHTNNLLSPGAATFTVRQAFEIPHNASAFRVHYRNRNFLTEADSPATISGFRSFAGEAEMGVNGPTGAFTKAPVAVQPRTTMVNGTEIVTPWISVSDLEVKKNTRYLLSTAFSCDEGEVVGVGGGGHFASFDGDKADQIAANGAFTRNQSFFDTYIEYLYFDDSAPSILVISNSLSGPGNVVDGYNRGDVDTWQHQWAMANRGVAASLAVGGSWAAQYPTTSMKWNHYNTLDAQIDYDAVILMAITSSDITGGDGSVASVQAARDSYGAIVNKVRALYPTVRIIGTTNPPRQASSGAVETARLAENTWLSRSPYSIEQCLDLDMSFRNGATPSRLKPEYDSGDGDHWSPRGHAWASQLIPVRSRNR